MIVFVNRNLGNPEAPPGSVVDATGWLHLDILLQQRDIRPATATELAAYQAGLVAAPPGARPKGGKPKTPDPAPETDPATPPAEA